MSPREESRTSFKNLKKVYKNPFKKPTFRSSLHRRYYSRVPTPKQDDSLNSEAENTLRENLRDFVSHRSPVHNNQPKFMNFDLAARESLRNNFGFKSWREEKMAFSTNNSKDRSSRESKPVYGRYL